MKKFLTVLFTILIIISFTATSVLAAGSERKNVTLVSVEYQKGGIVLIFETSGLKKADLKDRSFYADSNYQKITCNFVDDTDKVRCIVAKSLAGKGSFFVTVAGFGFWGELPKTFEAEACGEGQILWYNILLQKDEFVAGGPIPAYRWDDLVAQGFLEIFAANGVTYEITDTFCAPDEPFEN